MREQIENAQVLVASKTATYVGSTAGALSAWLGSLDWAFWISVTIGIGGFLMQFYFTRKKDRREHIEHLEKLKQIRGEYDEKK